MNTSPPTVIPTSVHPNPSKEGWVLILITCPHCGREHMHGGPEGDWAGHRTTDCHPAGYHLTDRSGR